MTSIVSPRSDGEPRSRRVERISGTGRERRRQIFEEAVAVIDIAAGDPHVSVDAIARAVLTSRRQVQRAFAEAGTTVRDVLRRARMERAERLLDDYRLSIADVGRLVGYEQAAEFARTFRRHAGCTPSEGRRARAHPARYRPARLPRLLGRQDAEAVLAEARATVPDDLVVTFRAVERESVANGLRHLALDEPTKMIILGSAHRARAARLLHHDIARSLMRHPPCPVVVAHGSRPDKRSARAGRSPVETMARSG